MLSAAGYCYCKKIPATARSRGKGKCAVWAKKGNLSLLMSVSHSTWSVTTAVNSASPSPTSFLRSEPHARSQTQIRVWRERGEEEEREREKCVRSILRTDSFASRRSIPYVLHRREKRSGGGGGEKYTRQRIVPLAVNDNDYFL